MAPVFFFPFFSTLMPHGGVHGWKGRGRKCGCQHKKMGLGLWGEKLCSSLGCPFFLFGGPWGSCCPSLLLFNPGSPGVGVHLPLITSQLSQLGQVKEPGFRCSHKYPMGRPSLHPSQVPASTNKELSPTHWIKVQEEEVMSYWPSDKCHGP